MTAAPETRYTRSADGINLAYQLTGDGPLDLVFQNGTGIPVDLLSEEPGFVRLRRRLDTFSRTVWFEGRGMGASEVTPERRWRERPALTSSRYWTQSGSSDRHSCRNWGTGGFVEIVAPSPVGDERFRARYARSVRFGGGADQIAEMTRAGFAQDARKLLPSVPVPTLVLHREGDRFIRVGAGRYLAEHIPNAKFVVLPGDDHLFFVGDTDALADEIEGFLTGARTSKRPGVLGCRRNRSSARLPSRSTESPGLPPPRPPGREPRDLSR